MTKHPSQAMQNVIKICADHMDAISACFKPGMKITILLRAPDFPDHSGDFVMTNDDFKEAAAAIAARDEDDPKSIRADV